MALFRALESLRPASSRLFCDPLAHSFLHDSRRWFYAIARLNRGRQLVEWLLDWNTPGARAAGIARTKWIDDQTEATLNNVSQLVLLGAGFDTRAFRLPSAHQVTTFELDLPETSAAKQAALRATNGFLPERVRFLKIDFNSQSIVDVLVQAEFDLTAPACFIWEGVTNYLSPEAVDRTLHEVRRSAVGSLLLFTYIDGRVLDRPEEFHGAEKLMSRLRLYGEPWTFGLHPEELDGYLAARGLQLVKESSVAQVWHDAGRPAADMRGYEFYRVAAASVPGHTLDA
jgi:methyltransferase (TIGR00027 family)